MTPQSNNGFLSWLHFGDLHITNRDQENYRDFERLARDANAHFAGRIDFAFLPGDNADNGTVEQYRLVKRVIDTLQMPLEIIPGDHDFEPGSLANFYGVLGAEPLPHAKTINGYRCLFVDLVAAGTGGPDFKLGDRQRAWLDHQLSDADAQNERCVVFMHTYPADLGNEAAAVHASLRKHDVVAVDMGHTHYNEIANDGRTVYMATRSTGQIEEGPVGFSIAAIDDGVVSWRFRELDHDRPFVLVTSPSDRRLARDKTRDTLCRRERLTVNAAIWSAHALSAVDCKLGNGFWSPMSRLDGGNRWSIEAERPAEDFPVAVRACDEQGNTDAMVIEVAAPDALAARRHADGSDADHIGVWAEIGLVGTQLGPNRNGRKW